MAKQEKRDGKKPAPKKEDAKKVEVKKVDTPKAYGRVRPCSCVHAFQDKEYGKGMRLHTEKKGASINSIRHCCTVCGTVKN